MTKKTKNNALQPDRRGHPPEFSTLRRLYHSIHPSEQESTIQLLGELKSPDASRELIQLFHECQWRKTRFKILRALALSPDSRSLPFLFECARNEQDIPIAEAAIGALSQTHHPLAARFLDQYYTQCPAVLSPAICGALGVLPSRTHLKRLIDELEATLQSEKLEKLRSLLLTLGELRAHEIEPQLWQILNGALPRSIQLCALVALGKISQDSKQIEEYQPKFSDDLLETQLFNAAQNQIQSRAQRDLGTLVQQLTMSDIYHRSMVFELTGHPTKQVFNELKEIVRKHPNRMSRALQILGHIDAPDIQDGYNQLVKPEQLQLKDIKLLLQSISQHQNDQLLPILEKIETLIPPFPADIAKSWVETITWSISRSEDLLAKKLSDQASETNGIGKKNEILNQLILIGITYQTDPSRFRKITKIIDEFMHTESNPELRTRALRGLGELKTTTPRSFQFIQKSMSSDELIPSILYFLQRCHSRESESILLTLMEKSLQSYPLQFLRAVNAQPKSLNAISKPLTNWVENNLGNSTESELTYECFQFIAKNPSDTLFNLTLKSLEKNPDQRLQAVIALKAFKDPRAADPLNHLLIQENEKSPRDESIIGRILDTIAKLPGKRPTRILMDYLVENFTDHDLVQHLCQLLNPSDDAISEYLIQQLDALIINHPEHIQIEKIKSLKDDLVTRLQTTDESEKKNTLVESSADHLDDYLKLNIPEYTRLDKNVRFALRSAEAPFHFAVLSTDTVDKSSSVLEYCKAIDLVLEREFGKRILFPKIESSLPDFQNILYQLELNGSYLHGSEVIQRLHLGHEFTPKTLPIQKLHIICQSILSGRILEDKTKTIDGLKAWAMILLIFARKPSAPNARPLLSVGFSSDQDIIHFCRRLILLQDIRNPAAHRHTVTQIMTVEDVRREALRLINESILAFSGHKNVAAHSRG